MKGLKQSSRKWSRSTLVLGLVALTVTGVLQACAPAEDEDDFIATCELPNDQHNTLTGRWKVAPVYIAFSTGEFNDYEKGLIMNAADVWNNFYSKVHGFNIIDYGTRQNPREKIQAKPASVCGTTLVNAVGAIASSIVIYKDTTGWGFAPAAIAITSTCASTDPTSSVKAMYSAIIELNYVNFFVAGKQTPDLTSILVHELGHLLGLDHSCSQSSASNPNPPLCSSSSLNPSYYEAAMYPTVNFKADGTSYPRRSLLTNDQGRANCLYGSDKL